MLIDKFLQRKDKFELLNFKFTLALRDTCKNMKQHQFYCLSPLIGWTKLQI